MAVFSNLKKFLFLTKGNNKFNVLMGLQLQFQCIHTDIHHSVHRQCLKQLIIGGGGTV